MVDRIIRVVIDPSGAQQGSNQVRGSLDGIRQSSRGTQQSLRALGRVAGIAFAALGIRELARAADGYTRLGSQINLVTNSQAQANNVTDEVISLAQRTRTELGTVAELYARVARNTRDLGLSQREIIDLTETVSQTLQISGASTAEAAGGVRQFTQSLASGLVRAEEFNSIVEQTPRLAEALSRGVGVGIGELRELVNSGQLTSAQVIEALQSQGAAVNAEFQNITPTLAQTGETIRTFGTVIVGSFNEAFGVTEGLNRLFLLTDEQTLQLAATVSNLGLNFREFVEVATVSIATFVDTVPERFSRLRADIAGTIGTILGDDAVIQAAIDQRIADTNVIEEARNRLLDETDAIRANTEARREALENRLSDLSEGVGGEIDSEPSIDPQVLEDQEAFLQGLRQQAAELNIQANAGDNAEAALLAYNTTIEASALGNSEFVESALELVDTINQQTAALESAQNQASDSELIESLESELELLQLGNVERAQEIALRELSAEATDEQIESVRQLSGAIAEQQERLSAESDFLTGLTEQAAGNIQSAFADFLFDPFDEGLRGLAQSFSQTLQRLAAEALANQILSAIAGAVGGPFGQLFSAGAGAARQTGGSVTAGDSFLVGEQGPELFTPPTSGNIIPAGQTSQAMAPMVSLSPQIINVRDPSEIPAAINSDPTAQQAILNVISNNPDTVRQASQTG